jgi:hypothetical protein
MMEPLGDRIIRLPIRTLEIQSRPIVATRLRTTTQPTISQRSPIMRTESIGMPVLRATSGWAN